MEALMFGFSKRTHALLAVGISMMPAPAIAMPAADQIEDSQAIREISRESSPQRMQLELGLAELPFARPKDDQATHHVFVQGCVVERAWMPLGVRSSDHSPQLADLLMRSVTETS
jgi:hypothetical protein